MVTSRHQTCYVLMYENDAATIEDDAAVQLERLRRERDASLKEVINDLAPRVA